MGGLQSQKDDRYAAEQDGRARNGMGIALDPFEGQKGQTAQAHHDHSKHRADRGNGEKKRDQRKPNNVLSHGCVWNARSRVHEYRNQWFAGAKNKYRKQHPWCNAFLSTVSMHMSIAV